MTRRLPWLFALRRLSLKWRAATWAMRGSRSTPIHSRPSAAATRPTVPAPANGSRTGPRFLLTSSSVRTTGSGIASHRLSGWERGSGSVQQSVVPRCRTALPTFLNRKR